MAAPDTVATGPAAAWLARLTAAKKTCVVHEGRKMFLYVLDQGQEMTEEYDQHTGVLLVRKFRTQDKLGGIPDWSFEVGEAVTRASAESQLRESSLNPVFARLDSKLAFEWRIRNLPYPVDVYSVTVENEKDIVLRTSNKKYFKRFQIADMVRYGLPLDQAALRTAHTNNTLVISYEKPPGVLAIERQLKQQRDAIKASKEGDVECAQS